MKINPVFSSHMVLPAGKVLRFFGEGSGVAEIIFAGIHKKVTTAEEKWEITFPPMEYSGPYTVKVILNGTESVLDDVYVGEVYQFSGQSNLQFKLEASSTPKEQYVSNPKLRLFTVDRMEDEEHFHTADGWVVATEENVGFWSAVGYLACQQISVEKDIAVGVIACYQGASVIETWMPEGTLSSLGINIPIEEKHGDHTTFPWNKDGLLYHYQLEKIAPYSLSGVVWYQGESNSSVVESEVYAQELCALITVWRKTYHDDSLPFVVVQLADFDDKIPGFPGWDGIQAAQLSVPTMIDNVKTVISRDVCETNDIHPPTKMALAQRVAEALM